MHHVEPDFMILFSYEPPLFPSLVFVAASEEPLDDPDTESSPERVSPLTNTRCSRHCLRSSSHRVILSRSSLVGWCRRLGGAGLLGMHVIFCCNRRGHEH